MQLESAVSIYGVLKNNNNKKDLCMFLLRKPNHTGARTSFPSSNRRSAYRLYCQPLGFITCSANKVGAEAGYLLCKALANRPFPTNKGATVLQKRLKTHHTL